MFHHNIIIFPITLSKCKFFELPQHLFLRLQKLSMPENQKNNHHPTWYEIVDMDLFENLGFPQEISCSRWDPFFRFHVSNEKKGPLVVLLPSYVGIIS